MAHSSPMTPTALESRLAEVRARIGTACARVGREASSVRLVAVSKQREASEVRALAALGVADFGENYAQEFVQKCDALGLDSSVRWHFIGHLQRNKVRSVVARNAIVHAVDSERLANAIERVARELQVRVSCLIEVNVSGEPSKSGVDLASLERLVEGVRACPSLDVCGLMTMAPANAEEDVARGVFATLRERSTSLGVRELSMGMSDDFEVAVEEGATLVRIGAALFGPRGESPTPS